MRIFEAIARKKFDQYKKCSIAQLKRIRTSVIHKRKISRMSLQEDKSSGQKHEQRSSAFCYVFQCRLCSLFLLICTRFNVANEMGGVQLHSILMYMYIERERERRTLCMAIRAICSIGIELREASTMQLYMLFLEMNACICVQLCVPACLVL